MDLEVDLAKFCSWSTGTAARATLRTKSLALELKVRMFGVHQNFCLRRGNATVTARIPQLDGLWKRLRRCVSPYRFKITALLTMAWPRALHGVSVVHVGPAWFKKLRAGAMGGLRSDRIGASSSFHLVCHAWLADPGVYAVVQTVKDARLFGFAVMESLLGFVSLPGSNLPFNGPTTVLAERLKPLTWELPGSGVVRDRFGLLSLFHCSFEEFWF